MENSPNEVLNVTLLEPKQKHPAIFDRFDSLPEGNTLVILNDHDPKPLYYQMLGERGNVFTWKYLEEGPQWWRVSITKRVSGAETETIGQIAAKDLRKAQVFKKYGLDFCCGGKKTLQEACSEKGLDVTRIEKELDQANALPAGRALPYRDWSLDFLADFIVQTHHGYVRNTLPQLTGYAEKVARVHGGRHPELLEVNKLVGEISAEMTSHMMKEERVLFPYIKSIVKSGQEGVPGQQAHFGTVQNPINMMEMEHEFVGGALARLREITNGYALPEDACASYSLLYRMLDEFENDLYLHVHLENNILFPGALALEQQISVN